MRAAGSTDIGPRLRQETSAENPGMTGRTNPSLPHRTSDPRPALGRTTSANDILENLQSKLGVPWFAGSHDAGVQTEPTRTRDAAVGPEDMETVSANHCPAPARRRLDRCVRDRGHDSNVGVSKRANLDRPDPVGAASEGTNTAEDSPGVPARRPHR